VGASVIRNAEPCPFVEHWRSFADARCDKDCMMVGHTCHDAFIAFACGLPRAGYNSVILMSVRALPR
jgi:hypothetical protein